MTKFLECTNGDNRDFECKCNPGYYEIDYKSSCESCIPPCQNCSSLQICISK